MSSTEQVNIFEKIVQNKVENIFPQKTVRLAVNFDQPFFTSDLKKLDRQAKREYRKHYKSQKYLDIREK